MALAEPCPIQTLCLQGQPFLLLPDVPQYREAFLPAGGNKPLCHAVQRVPWAATGQQLPGSLTQRLRALPLSHDLPPFSLPHAG